MRDETILLIAAGVVGAGLFIHHKLTGGEFLDDVEPILPLGPTPALPLPIAPGGTAATTPAATTPAPTPAAPMTPVQANAAFEAASAQAHAAQEEDYQQQVAELQRRVAAGDVQVGSPYYNSTVDYLANMRGGVATKDAERAILRAQGLAGRRHLRLV